MGIRDFDTADACGGRRSETWIGRWRGPDRERAKHGGLHRGDVGGARPLDVECLCDGEGAWIAGILEHVAPAGVHSGDSACVTPPPTVTAELEDEIRELTSALARKLGARGLLNLQIALLSGRLYVLEANPRASRTVPFVAKATGLPLVEHACRLLLGESLGDLGLPARAVPTRAWAKEAVFPSERFPETGDRGRRCARTARSCAGGVTVSEAYARALARPAEVVAAAAWAHRFSAARRSYRVRRRELRRLDARSPRAQCVRHGRRNDPLLGPDRRRLAN